VTRESDPHIYSRIVRRRAILVIGLILLMCAGLYAIRQLCVHGAGTIPENTTGIAADVVGNTTLPRFVGTGYLLLPKRLFWIRLSLFSLYSLKLSFQWPCLLSNWLMSPKPLGGTIASQYIFQDRVAFFYILEIILHTHGLNPNQLPSSLDTRT
jgi:hypothetical protein